MGHRTAPDATVVIPARNSAATLPRQLGALARQDFAGRWEVVVAENGSTDATASIVREHAAAFPAPLRLVDAAHRRGANVARNAGVRATRGSRVLFCDSDDEVAPSWVRAHVDALEMSATTGGPLDYATLNPPDIVGRGLEVPSSIQEHRGFRYALTANFAARREVFARVGLFDERFELGFDEVDFGYRVHLAGLSLRDAGAALVHYRLRTARTALVHQHYRYGVGSRMFHEKYPELHDPLVDPLRARVVSVAKQTARLALAALDDTDTRDRRLRAFGYAVGELGLTRRGRRVGPRFG